jgi:aldehyde dehydrogenase (NAD+)
MPDFQINPGQLFINGVWQPSRSGKTFATFNPATEAEITQIAEGDEGDLDLAVAAARAAFESGPWAKMSGHERGRILMKVGDLIMQHADELAYRETIDMGKPIGESRNIDVPFVANLFHYYAGWASKIEGSVIPVQGSIMNYTLREPLGVIGAITPFNFPLLLTSWKVAPALACGNVVIHKPASITPLTAIKLAEIMQEAGIPAGVYNLVTGPGKTIGAAMARHPGIDKIAFTGETETGKGIIRDSAATLKKVSLELGGKSPNIILADADLDGAVKAAFMGIFYNKGEVCAAGSRLFIEKPVYEEVLAKLGERVKKTKPGDPLDPKTRFGPVASKSQLDKVLSYVEIGQKEGATLAVGGHKADIGTGKGFFVEPTLFSGATNQMRIAREEIFGPVLTVIPVDDFESALQAANDSAYGLAAAIHTRDIKKAHRAAKALKAGTVWVNTYNLYDPASPFGGYKQSGFGRELGKEALDGYLQTKSVWVDLS